MRRPSWNSTWSRSRSSRLTSSWKRSRKWKMKPSQSSWPWNRYGYPGRARSFQHITWLEEKFGACTQPLHNLLTFWWQDLSPGEHACTHCRCSLLNSHVSTKWNFPGEYIFTAGTWLYIRFWGHYFLNVLELQCVGFAVWNTTCNIFLQPPFSCLCASDNSDNRVVSSSVFMFCPLGTQNITNTSREFSSNLAEMFTAIKGWTN